ncbi:hypothetical protein ACFFHK_01725 [Gallibacterium trehalosifermentans]|uniref:Tubulin/FtsZ GTPase domain-containing protein n=1 Tax=Gallibacterium trehalosifermentans TaxID=516935 RepID=A0ABV6GYJ8_9PAST
MRSNQLIGVLGIGGCGLNALNYIIDNIQMNADNEAFIVANGSNKYLFYAIDRNKEVLNKSKAQMRWHLSDKLDEISTEEKLETKLQQMVGTCDFVILVSGGGGQTGSIVTPAIADKLKSLNIPCLAIVVMPFDFEGKKRHEVAESTVNKLNESCITKVINNTILQQTEDASFLQMLNNVNQEIMWLVLNFNKIIE